MIFTPELVKRIACRGRVNEPSENAYANNTPWAMRRLSSFGYGETPASKAICRFILAETFARKSEEGADGFVQHDYTHPVRGIALIGTVGTGKTTALNALSAMFQWPIFPLAAMAANWATGGNDYLDQFISENRSRTIILDDLGTEQEGGRNFNLVLPVSYIIGERYDSWRFRRSLTLFSTNLRREQRLTLYGERIEDRLSEMCDYIPCCWESFRKNGGVRHGAI